MAENDLPKSIPSLEQNRLGVDRSPDMAPAAVRPDHQDLPSKSAEKPSKKSRAVGKAGVAWIVICSMTALLVFLQLSRAKQAKTADAKDTPDYAFELRIMELQGKVLIATKQLSSADSSTNQDSITQAIESLNRGPLPFRFRYITLVGETQGAKQALEKLNELKEKLNEQQIALSESDAEVIRLLAQHYAHLNDQESPGLSQADSVLLNEELGWFGSLALSPPTKSEEASPGRKAVLQAANKPFLVQLIGVVALLLIGVLGLAGAVTFVSLMLARKVKSGLMIGSRFGAVYAETFACWLVCYFAFSFAAAFRIGWPALAGVWVTCIVVSLGIWLTRPVDDDDDRSHASRLRERMIYFVVLLSFCVAIMLTLTQLGLASLQLSAAVAFLSLSCLCWPIVRGVNAKRMLFEVGLHPRRGFQEVLWGVVCYVSTLPLLLLGFFITLVLISSQAKSTTDSGNEFSVPDMPSHPIIESIGEGELSAWLQMMFVAAVMAPLVEEIAFRGVLFRHLREATRSLRISLSVIVSAIVSSLIFAVIHPQGLLTVPVLASLAIGFCLTREWRGSLIAPMTMHAIHNGTIVTLVFVALKL